MVSGSRSLKELRHFTKAAKALARFYTVALSRVFVTGSAYAREKSFRLNKLLVKKDSGNLGRFWNRTKCMHASNMHTNFKDEDKNKA